MDWIEKWRLDHGSLLPRKVKVYPVSEEYVIVEGDEHTSYAGAFFYTVDEMYAHAIAETERSLRHATDLIDGLERNRRLARAVLGGCCSLHNVDKRPGVAAPCGSRWR